MHLLLLLSSVAASLGKSPVYVVTGGFKGNYDGLYEERRQPVLHYKKLGKPDQNGKLWFLYPDKSFPPTWMIGQGNSVLSAKAYFRSTLRAEDAPVSDWLYVSDGSRMGEEEGWASTGVRVTRVEEQLSGKELLKQVQRKEDVVKEKYIVCSRSNDLHRSFGKRLVIARDSRDPFYCNGPSECKSKADEPCPYVTIHSSSSFPGSINISREHLEGMKNDQGTKSLRRRGRDRSTSTVYIVTGTYGFWDGVYQEESSPVRHYRMMGASSGYTKFLYTDVDEPSCWMIGHGEDISSAFAVFRGHSDLDGGPPLTGWTDVADGTRSGAELEEHPYPIDVRVTGVQENADSMLSQLKGSEDVVTSQYVICDRSLSLHRSYGRRLIVARTAKDPFYCNGPSECQTGADEMCWQVDNSLN